MEGCGGLGISMEEKNREVTFGIGLDVGDPKFNNINCFSHSRPLPHLPTIHH
jgi:hypothetical protein